MIKVIFLTSFVVLSPCLGTFELKLNIRLLDKIIEDVLSIVYGVEIFEKTGCPPVSNEDILIYLSTSWNPHEEYLITPGNLKNLTHFNSSLETKFLTHGWLSGGKVDWLVKMKDVYIERDHYNILILGWDKFSVTRYSLSRCYLTKIGEKVGHFIYYLHQNQSMDLNKIHLIGHSLGAHLFAIAAQTVRNLTENKKIGRITGLDPAGPMFCQPHFQHVDKRLSKDDAYYVDVIHTNGGEFGCRETIGHADFFPNCGTKQPGCSEFSVRLLDITETFNNFLSSIMCSHGRSHEIWIESILNNIFIAQKCRMCSLFELEMCNGNKMAFMGEISSEDTDGKFYLSTSNRFPYSKRRK